MGSRLTLQYFLSLCFKLSHRATCRICCHTKLSIHVKTWRAAQIARLTRRKNCLRHQSANGFHKFDRVDSQHRHPLLEPTAKPPAMHSPLRHLCSHYLLRKTLRNIFYYFVWLIRVGGLFSQRAIIYLFQANGFFACNQPAT